MKLVWVNVWGRVPLQQFATLVLASSVAWGCIDDFDHPKGYGRAGGAGDYDCESLCDESERCDNGASASECRSQCGMLEGILRRSGCDDPFDDVLECLSNARDVCSAQSDVCQPEVEDFTSCFSRYCSSYPEDCSF
jgi:hypothetical protein